MDTNRRRATPIARVAYVGAALLFAGFGALMAWVGGLVATMGLTGRTQDGPYLLIGLSPLCLAAVAAGAAWLVLGTPYRPRHPSAKGLFAALAFALPTAIGAIMVIRPEGARNAALAARLYTVVWLLTPLVVAALLLLLLRTMMAAR